MFVRQVVPSASMKLQQPCDGWLDYMVKWLTDRTTPYVRGVPGAINEQHQ